MWLCLKLLFIAPSYLLISPTTSPFPVYFEHLQIVGPYSFFIIAQTQLQYYDNKYLIIKNLQLKKTHY